MDEIQAGLLGYTNVDGEWECPRCHVRWPPTEIPYTHRYADGGGTCPGEPEEPGQPCTCQTCVRREFGTVLAGRNLGQACPINCVTCYGRPDLAIQAGGITHHGDTN